MHTSRTFVTADVDGLPRAVHNDANPARCAIFVVIKRADIAIPLYFINFSVLGKVSRGGSTGCVETENFLSFFRVAYFAAYFFFIA